MTATRTPFDIYESLAAHTKPERLKVIQRDLELLLDGWTIHVAVDPYDLGLLCFPFDASDLGAELLADEVEKRSRLQNGRYEAFYRATQRPILLQPYVPEVERLLDWASWSTLIQDDAQTLDRYFDVLRMSDLSSTGVTSEEIVNLTHQHLSSAIAVATGIVSTGVKRLRELVESRLVRGSPDGTGRPLGIPLESRGPAYEIAFKHFQEAFDRLLARQQREFGDAGRDGRPLRSLAAITDSNKRDATAVAHLLHLNQIYAPQRALVIYLSSAPKSHMLFESGKLTALWPRPDGSPYNPLRTAEDFFLWMDIA